MINPQVNTLSEVDKYPGPLTHQTLNQWLLLTRICKEQKSIMIDLTKTSDKTKVQDY